jgi:hypothetical protein
MNKWVPRLIFGMGMFQIFGTVALAGLAIGIGIFAFLLLFHLTEGRHVAVIIPVGSFVLVLYIYGILARNKTLAAVTLGGWAVCWLEFLFEMKCCGTEIMWLGLCVIVLGQGLLGIYLAELSLKLKAEAAEQTETGLD